MAADETQARRHKTRIRWLKRGLGVLFAVGVVVAIVLAWVPRPVPVDVAKASRGPMQVTVDEDGRTRVQDRYVVDAPIAGSLARIDLDPGDAVHAHEVVARIMPVAPPLLDVNTRAQAEAKVGAAEAAEQQAHANVARVRAALELARHEAQRQRMLADQGSVPLQIAERAEVEARTTAEELASAEFAARVAEHEVEVARALLGRLEGGPGAAGSEQFDVRSPVDGEVLRVMQESEAVVQPGTPLLEVGDPSALEIVTDVLTTDAVSIEPGDRVHVERWGGGYELEGRVRIVEPSAFTRLSALGVEEQRVNVIIDLTSPRARWRDLGDGYRVETRIVVWQARDVLTVPASAVFRHRGGWAVFTVRGGRARLSRIRIGRRNDLQVQVLRGVSKGREVILHPSDRVTDGVRVTPR